MIKIFISAHKNNDDAWTNEQNTNRLYNKLQDLQHMRLISKFESCAGCYKGTIEKSFQVACNENSLNLLRWFAVHLQQESILIVEQYYGAEYAYLMDSQTGRKHSASRWLAVTESEAIQCNAYSVVDGQYYTTWAELAAIGIR